MSNYFGEFEEGEIQSEDDFGAFEKPNLDLEDLSSGEELFRTDTAPSYSIGKEKKYMKVSERECRATIRRKKEYTAPMAGSKRTAVRKQVLVPPSRASAALAADDNKRGSRPRRRQPQRECTVSISPETVSGSRRGAERCAERVLTRGRSGNKLNTVNAKKEVEASGSLYPEKAVPKTSLKRRLQTMLNLSTLTVKEDNDQGTVQLIDQELNLATKESDDCKPEKKILGMGKKRKRSISTLQKEPCQIKSQKIIKEAVVGDSNVEKAGILERDQKEATPEPAKNASRLNNTSITGDEDLAELRKLALESSVVVASKKSVADEVITGTTTSCAPTAEELDDLTELRLQALRSAMIKKHIARKAKAAAAAATASGTIPSPPTFLDAHDPQPPAAKSMSPEQQHIQSVSVTPVPSHEPKPPKSISLKQQQAHTLSAAPPPPFPPVPILQPLAVKFVHLEQQQAHTASVALPSTFPATNGPQPQAVQSISLDQQALDASWKANGFQCADNCDKTTLIVDMDLGNTSDEDSQNADSGDCVELCKNSSPYYVPERWTQFPERELEPQNVKPHNFQAQSYQSDLLIPLTTPMEIPSYAHSMYDTRQEPSMLPIITPAQMFHPQNVVPVPNIRLNKYSERPNLIILPVTPKQQHSTILTPKKMTECFPFSDSSIPGYSHGHNESRASALIHIDLQTEPPKNVETSHDLNEVTTKGTASPIWNDVANSSQGQSPSEFADSSDTENMDISSMIVVDEVVCTSPEPETCMDTSYSGSILPDTSNVLTDVPVPSSQYTNRSMLPNNSSSTMGTVQITKPPNVVLKQKYPPTNPFILNNVHRPFQTKKRENTLLSTKRRVSQAQGNLNIVISNQPYLEAAKQNQPPLNSMRVSNVHSPTTNAGHTGRFVINLGDDSDTDDEVQKVENPELMKFPTGSPINERGLQQDTFVAKPPLIPFQADANFSAHLDAFLRDTRAKYDRKTAVIKEKNSEPALCSTSSTTEVKACTTNKHPSGDLTSNVHGKDLGTGEVLYKTSAKSPKMKLTTQNSGRVHISSFRSSHTVDSEQNLEQKMGANKVMFINQSVLRTLNETADQGKQVCNGTSIKSNTSLTSNCLQPNQTVTSSAINRVPSKAQLMSQNRISPDIVKTVKTPNSLAACPQLSARVIGNPKTRTTIANAYSTGGSITSEKKVAETFVPTAYASGSMKTPHSSAAHAKFMSEVVKKPKTRITMEDTTSSGCERSCKTKLGHSSVATVAKPQALQFSSVKASKCADPSKAFPKSDSDIVPPGNKQSSEPDVIVLDIINEKADSESITQTLKACKPLKCLSSPISNSKPQTLVKPLLMSPISTEEREVLQEFQNIEEAKSQQKGAGTPVDNQNLTGQMEEMALKLTEKKLLQERTSLLLDLTLILEQLNDSSRAERAIAEMQETILQQEKIVELAKQSIRLTRERMANETKKRVQTFSLINNKRKTVASNRDLCNKLRDQCVTLGLKVKGESYVAPQPLEAELRMRLEDVAAGISKTMKCVTPRKKVVAPRASSSDETESPDIRLHGRTLINAATGDGSKAEHCSGQEVAAPQALPPDSLNLSTVLSQKSDENYKAMSWAVECPYEIIGICGDINDCPFVHKKHR